MRGILAARSVAGRVEVAETARIGRRVRFDVARGGSLRVGPGCRVGDGCRIVVCAGFVDLGAGCLLGEGCTLIARREITVGERSRLGDGVSILDFGPAPTDTERPTRVQPLHTSAVVLDAEVEIGLRAAIGPGTRLGRGARVEPGAVLGALAEPLLAHCEPLPLSPPAGEPRVRLPGVDGRPEAIANGHAMAGGAAIGNGQATTNGEAITNGEAVTNGEVRGSG